jgi:hypothetical protein
MNSRCSSFLLHFLIHQTINSRTLMTVLHILRNSHSTGASSVSSSPPLHISATLQPQKNRSSQLLCFCSYLKVSSEIRLNQKAEYWLSDGCAAMLSCPQLPSSVISILWAIQAPAINRLEIINESRKIFYNCWAYSSFRSKHNLVSWCDGWKYPMKKATESISISYSAHPISSLFCCLFLEHAMVYKTSWLTFEFWLLVGGWSIPCWFGRAHQGINN